MKVTPDHVRTLFAKYLDNPLAFFVVMEVLILGGVMVYLLVEHGGR